MVRWHLITGEMTHCVNTFQHYHGAVALCCIFVMFCHNPKPGFGYVMEKKNILKRLNNSHRNGKVYIYILPKQIRKSVTSTPKHSTLFPPASTSLRADDCFSNAGWMSQVWVTKKTVDLSRRTTERMSPQLATVTDLDVSSCNWFWRRWHLM